MGRLAAELSDHVIVTSDNPRSENPDAIIQEILTGIPAKHSEAVETETDREKAIARMKATNEKFAQKYPPTAEDMARHPSMHRTDTLDIIFVFKGEIYLITDVEEILCTPGDCIIIRGTNHGWSVRGTEPCMCMGVMLSAHPLS